MTIDSVPGVGQTTPPQPAVSKGTGQMENLGQDAFLTLLLAQLKNQDPLNRPVTPTLLPNWLNSTRSTSLPPSTKVWKS